MGNKSAVKERRPQAQAPARAEGPVQADACRHHWLIESPHGALSRGRCKVCGAEREFRNSANDYIWDDDSSSGYGGGIRSSVRSSPKMIEEDDMVASSPSTGREAALAV